MADSIERIAADCAWESHRLRNSGAELADYEAWERIATRLRALSPAGGDWVMVLADVLERDGGKACNCINHSRKAEREYEAGQCPHQRAAAMLAASPQQEPEESTFGHGLTKEPVTITPSGQTLAGAGGDGGAHRLAARIGMRYTADESCDIGAPFYAFTEKELDKFVDALTATSAGTTGDAELPEPAAYAVRESIGGNLWFFTTKRADAHDNVGYKDSVEPLYTADQMREYARRAREVG